VSASFDQTSPLVARPATRDGSRRRRVTWTIADQALSSFTNFGLGIVVAREVGARSFGAFSIAYSTYLIVLGLSRAMHSDPLLIRSSDTPADARRQAARSAVGSALVLSIPVAALCIGVAFLLAGPITAPLAALALFLPGLLVQDAYRFAFFALGTPARAAANDALWAVFLVVAFGAAIKLVQPTAALLLGAWGAAAALAALIAPWQMGAAPSPTHVAEWLRTNSDLGMRYAIDFLAMLGALQLIIFAIGLIAGLAAAGSVRAAGILLGPITVLFFAAQSAAVPEGVRIARHSRVALERMCWKLALVLTGLGLLWVGCLAVLPGDIGRTLLGASWPGARRVLVLLGVSYAISGVPLAANIGLRVLGDARRSLHARMQFFPVVIALGVGGAVIAGARGAAAGLLVSELAASAIWSAQFRQSVQPRANVARGPSARRS